MNINETALIESATLREQYTDTSVLDRVKVVPTLPDDLHLTTEMVATFYDVDKETITTTVQRNKDELSRNGLRVLKGAELRQLKDELAGQGTDARSEHQSIGARTASLTLFNRRTLLNVGMLLRDSEVAKQVRMYLLEVEESATAEQKDSATVTAIEKLTKRVEELSENLGDFNSIENDANGLSISVVADMLGIAMRDLREYLAQENWIHQPYQNSSNYHPTDWALKADLVEYPPKKKAGSTRITANGRRVLRKNLNL